LHPPSAGRTSTAVLSNEGASLSSDSQPLLVFFTNPRSGPARRMESLVAHVARKERARLRVHHVDIDAQPELARHFRVTTVPTLALVRDKRVVGRLEGRVSAPQIEQLLEAHLGQLEAA
jgi:thioredoxin-like negative regulator of GroEL